MPHKKIRNLTAKNKPNQVSKAKAKKILADGSINGRKLTAKQKKFFGAIASRTKK